MPKSSKNKKSLQSYITEAAENFVKVEEQITEIIAYKVEMNKTANQQFQQHLQEEIKETTFKNLAKLPIKKDLFGKSSIEEDFEIKKNFEVLKTEVLGWRELSLESHFPQVYDAFKAKPLTDAESAIIREKLLNVAVNYHENIITEVEVVKKENLDLNSIDCVNKLFRTAPPVGKTVIKYKINEQYYDKYRINNRFNSINEQNLFLNDEDGSLTEHFLFNSDAKQQLKEICQPIGITFLRNREVNETSELVNSNPEKCVYVLVDDTNPVQGSQITKQLIKLAEKSFPTLEEKAVASAMQTLKINERNFTYDLNEPIMPDEYKAAKQKLKSAIMQNAENNNQKLTPEQFTREYNRAIETAREQYLLKKQAKLVEQAKTVADSSGMTEYFDGKEVTSLEVHEQTKMESKTLTKKKTQKTLRSLDQSRVTGRGKGRQTVVERLFTTEKPVETPKKTDDTTKKSQKQADYESSSSSSSSF